MEAFMQFLPLEIICVLLALGMYFLAPRVGGNKWLWVVLSIIPLVNFFFMYYVAFKVVFAILDNLKAIREGLARSA